MFTLVNELFVSWLNSKLVEKGWSQADLSKRAQVSTAMRREQDPKVVPVQHPVHAAIVKDIRLQFLAGLSFNELQAYLTEWMLDDDPKIVNALLLRLIRQVNITIDGQAIPVLRK